MGRLRHVELWSTWSFAPGAARVGRVLLTVRNGRTKRRVGGERSKTFQVAMGDLAAPAGNDQRELADAFADVQPNRVARFVLTDGSWAEWLILDVDDASHGDGFATVTCSGLSAALEGAPAVRLVDADGRATFRFDAAGLTLAQHWTNYLAPRLTDGGLGFVVLGTDESAGAKDVVFDADNPWQAIQQLAEVFGLEVDITREDGSSEYRVHFVRRVGGGVTGPRLSTTEGASIRRRRSRVPQRTRLEGVGQEGCTIGDAVWVIASKASNDLGLADPAGGPGPLLDDAQLNGLWLEAADRTTRVQITAGVAGATQTVTVTSGAAFAIGDRVRVRADSAGTRLVGLEDPVAVAASGRISGVHRRDDIPETVNLAPNADMALWSGTASDPPDGWAAVATPTLTRTTAAQHVVSGGKSCRVETNADGEGLAGPLVTVQPTPTAPYGSGFLVVKLVSGRIRIEMVATNGTSTWVLPDGITQKAVPDPQRVGVFDANGVAGIHLKDLGATSVRMRVVQDGPGTAEFYVDAVQVTESGGQLPLVYGAGPTQLWQAVNDQLALVAPVTVRLEGDAVDFHRLDAAAFPYHQFTLGAEHEVVVPRLGLVDGIRVLEIEEDDDVEASTSLVLSSLPEDLRSLQARRPVARHVLAGAAVLQAGVRTITDGQTISPNYLQSATQAGFTPEDVGKTVWILGGGVDGIVLKTRIASLYAPSPTTRVVLTDNIAFQSTGLTAIIGPADQVATIGAGVGGARAGGAFVNDTGNLRPSAKDWASRAIDRFFAKTGSGDADTFDGVPDGATFIKVIPFLTIKADQSSITSTTVVVTITVSDPSGGAAPTISHNGGGAVTGSGPYTIARPAAGAGPILVTFTATKTGRVAQSVTVTAPEQESGGGTVPPFITALRVTAESTANNTITLAWGVENAPAGYTLDLRWERDGGADGGNEGTITGISTTSPYVFDTDLQDANVDIVAKGSGGDSKHGYAFELRMKNSGGTIVATATCFYAPYMVVTP